MSFDAPNLEKTDSCYALNVEVFEYDRYDPADIEKMAENDGLYRTIAMDDYPVYYSVGTVAIHLSEELTLEDYLDLEKELYGEVSDLAGFLEVLNREDTVFSCPNTIITVRQERMLQPIRYWTP